MDDVSKLYDRGSCRGTPCRGARRGACGRGCRKGGPGDLGGREPDARGCRSHRPCRDFGHPGRVRCFAVGTSARVRSLRDTRAMRDVRGRHCQRADCTAVLWCSRSQIRRGRAWRAGLFASAGPSRPGGLRWDCRRRGGGSFAQFLRCTTRKRLKLMQMQRLERNGNHHLGFDHVHVRQRINQRLSGLFQQWERFVMAWDQRLEGEIALGGVGGALHIHGKVTTR